MTPAIETVGLVKHFGKTRAVAGIDLEVQRASEEEREHQGHHEREHCHVKQLKRHVLDLEERAPPQSYAGGQRARGRRPHRPGQHAVHAAAGGGHRRGGHERSSGLSRSAVCPVSAKNTSSRLGWPRENSATATPPLESAARASPTRASSAACAVSRSGSLPL
jgi:hypothetical protein